MSTKKRYLVTVPVWGPLYTPIFLELHLRSFLDETNINFIKEHFDGEYRIFTDKATAPQILEHPNIKRLRAFMEVVVIPFSWARDDVDKFGARYGVLTEMFHRSVEYALTGIDKNEKGEVTRQVEPYEFVTAWVGDLYIARDFYPRVFKKMDPRFNGENHDSVFIVPLRGAFEPTKGHLLQSNRALQAHELFKLCFHYLHPLWVASHWGERCFTRMPYTLIWKSLTGMLIRTFQPTPIVFKPKKEMLKSGGMIDADIPQFFDNPYWCKEWTEAPVAGIEPLFCHYPPFQHQGCRARDVKKWSRRVLHPSQIPFLKHRIYYPDKKTARINIFKRLRSNAVVGRIV